MGSLILCHGKKARQPYEISRVHIKIYTIEELCYYIYHHIYLVDYTFVNHQLCDWISEELELEKLADDLKNILNEDGSVEDFIYHILNCSYLYSIDEIDYIMDDLHNFNEQIEVEKEKFKADQLMKNGEIESAVFIYLRIINQAWDQTIDPVFYGKVYANLGSAYGKLFLYEQSADMYKEACKYITNEDIIKAYLYACHQAYPEEIYADILSSDPDYLSYDEQITKTTQEMRGRIRTSEDDIQINVWKNNNRGFHKI